MATRIATKPKTDAADELQALIAELAHSLDEERRLRRELSRKLKEAVAEGERQRQILASLP